MSQRTIITDTVAKVGEKVTVSGWVHRVRDHSKVLFVDLRDRSGILQVVTGGWAPESFEVLKTVGPEDVISITGTVAARPEKLINPDLATGTVELQAETAVVLSKSQTPPFEVNEDTREVDEELRLQYRYLDLRTERMQKNLRNRFKIISNLRTQLNAQDFVEVETPLLTASTPEGARDYIVPTRKKGTFYALPQSPQQFKQLLMAAGIEKYYQFAKCMRDEDSRGDRQPEFTQLDMELSFVEREDVMALNEQLLITLVKEIYPQKKIQQLPFPRLTYQEAMDKYGTDRPDLRENKEDSNLLAFCWIIDFPFFEKTDTGGWTFTHNPFSMPKAEHEEWLMKGERIGEILTSQYDIVLNGSEIGGGSIRNHKPKGLRRIFQIMGYDEKHIDEHFGHMMTAFSYGTPPHGGIAWGLDRLITILQNEPNIREVMAFPKTGEGRDPLMNAPGPISDAQLNDLGLSLKK